MTQVHVLRVFTNASGRFGNPLGIVLDGASVRPSDRQQLAARIGFSELVFVDDLSTGRLQIFAPSAELRFAGHPLVGTGWLLSQQIKDTAVLRPPAGDVPTWQDGSRTWIRGRPEWSPQFERIQLDSPAAVDSLFPTPDHDYTQFWAWQDRASGQVRARVFAGRAGIVEDEACGAASLLLTNALQQPVTILHGEGSVIYAQPGPAGTVDIGGEVVLDDVREIAP